MKKLLIYYVFSFVAMTANATPQTGDIAYVNGEQWEMMCKPIGWNSEVWDKVMMALPKDRVITSANWNGYDAFWSVKDNQLCLDSVRYERRNKTTGEVWMECMPADTLKQIMCNFLEGDLIVAKWMSQEIRLCRGHVIYHQYIGFERYFDTELLLTVENGTVVEMQTCNNEAKEGFSFDQLVPVGTKEANVEEMFPVQIERYPELDGIKTVYVMIEEAEVDSTGYLTHCKVKIRIRKGQEKISCPALEEDMEASLKAYHPWRYIYLHGKPCAFGIANFPFPYTIKLNVQ